MRHFDKMRKHFDNISFLELYRDLPVLWDRNNPDYKNRKARDEAEAKMLEVFDFDCARELRNKIRSLRNTYNLELQRIHASIKAGADPDDAYTPKLVWFSLADSFLGKNMDESAEVWLEPSGRDYDELAEASDGVPIKSEPPPSRKRSKRRDKAGSKRKLRRRDSSAARQTAEELVGASEFVVFGQHVAIQLEKLPLRAALRLQERIQSLITRARVDGLRRGGGSERELAEDQQDPISSEESSS